MRMLILAGSVFLFVLGCAPAQNFGRHALSGTLTDHIGRWPKAVIIESERKAGPLFHSDRIIPLSLYHNNHGSSIAELGNGDLLITWFAGTKEGSADSQIFAVRYSKKTGRYSDPRAVVQTGEITEGIPGADLSFGNTALFRDDEGVTWLFYNVIPFGGSGTDDVNYKVSFDDGSTWSVGRRFTTVPGYMVRNKPIKLARRTLLLPLYSDMTPVRSFACALEIANGAIISKRCSGDMPLSNAIQPTIVRVGKNVLLAFLRDTTRHWVRRSWSYDNGASWSGADATDLPNPGSAIDAVRLHDGRILIAYNDSPHDRTPLSLAVSEDNGVTFQKVADLEVGEEESGYSYPTLLQTSDSLIHITYTYRRQTIVHATFNTEWLLAGAGSKGGR